MKLKPIGNRILAKRIIEEKKTASGLLLPESVQRKDRFQVIRMGQCSDIPEEIKLGSVVYCEKYSPHEITQDEETFVILRADDIIAVEIV